MGISSIVSRLLGEARHDAAARYVTDAQILALLLSVVIAVLVGFSFKGIFSAMGATDQVLPYISDYMYVLILGLPVIMIAVICGNTFRAIGAMKTSASMSSLLALLNLALDPLLIFGPGPFPEMGMKGRRSPASSPPQPWQSSRSISWQYGKNFCSLPCRACAISGKTGRSCCKSASRPCLPT